MSLEYKLARLGVAQLITDGANNAVLDGAYANYAFGGVVPETNDSAGITVAIAAVAAMGGSAVMLLPVEYAINSDITLLSGVSLIGVPPRLVFTADVPEEGVTVTGGTRFVLSAGVTALKANNVDNTAEDANIAAAALNGITVSGITFTGGARAIDIGAYLKIGAMGCIFDQLYGFNQTEDFAFNFENFQGLRFGYIYAHTLLTTGGGIRLANTLSNTFIPGNATVTDWLFVFCKNRLNRGVVIESAGPTTGVLNEIKVAGRLQCNRYGVTTPDIIAFSTTSGAADIAVPNAALLGIKSPVVFATTAPAAFATFVAYFVISRDTTANTVRLAESPYDTVAITPTSTGSFNASYSGYPAIEIVANTGNIISNSDFGQLDAESIGNVCALLVTKTRNCVAFAAEVMTSLTDTQFVARDAEIGITYGGAGNRTQDQSTLWGYATHKNTAGGPWVYSGGSFTLTSAYEGRTVRYSGTADITITVPHSLPKGFSMSVTTTAATGIVTFTTPAGGAIFSKAGLRTNGQNSTVTLENIGNKVFSLSGDTDLTASASLDFPSIAAAASADLTIAVAGATVNKNVTLGLPAAPTAGIVYQAFVSAADTVTVRATNITAGAIDPVAATFRVAVS